MSFYVKNEFAKAVFSVAWDNIMKKDGRKLAALLRVQRKRIWVRYWLLEDGLGENKSKKWEEADVKEFVRAFRITPKAFHELLTAVEPEISKQNTRMRKAVPARAK